MRVLESSHSRLSEYRAEFHIDIPAEEDRQRFLAAIGRMEEEALLETTQYPNGEPAYAFPLGEYWVSVSGKDGRYVVTKTAVFRAER